jgi:NAD(P)-dependent dehydrogenase (short-subunit alcohol dehydrogenase family)
VRTILITGGSRGIGKALVSAFKAQGDRVFACARKAIASAEADLFFECDVADRVSVAKLRQQVIQVTSRIDVLINNAGLAGSNGLTPEDSDSLSDEILNVNLGGTYNITKSFLPLIEKPGGRIINISSVLGLVGVPDQSAYCAAKHGVIGFTRSLALKLASEGVTVNAICPGWTRTDMATGRLRELGLSEQAALRSTPLKRWVEPGEVASLAVYLAGQNAGNITGKAWSIDGGAIPR